MAVTEPERLALHAAARGALGPEEGDTLMASLPPANTDIATRQGLERLEHATRRDIERSAERLESRMRAHTLRVVIGTGVALYVATVGTVLGIIAVLLQVIDR